MAEITNFYRVDAFEPELLKCLCDAHDCVMRSLYEKGQAFTIAPEVVAMHIISLAKQGVSGHQALCTRTLRILSGRSALSPDLRADHTEYLSYIRSSGILTGQKISSSVALIDEGRALMAHVERQLIHSSGCIMP